jgi:hypothetical protein
MTLTNNYSTDAVGVVSSLRKARISIIEDEEQPEEQEGQLHQSESCLWHLQQDSVTCDHQPHPSRHHHHISLCSSLKRSESVGSRTLATMAESEYSIVTSDEGRHHDHLDDADADDNHPTCNKGDCLEDSLSSHDDLEEDMEHQPSHREQQVLVHNIDSSSGNSSNNTILDRNIPRTRVPSSLHIPIVVMEEEEKEEEWETISQPRAMDQGVDDITKPVLDTKDPGATATTTVTPIPSKDIVACTSKSSSDIATTTATTSVARPCRMSINMIKYKPTDRSITVALTPAKSNLRKHSAYRKLDVHDTIPLDFNKRGSVRVLPKPDLGMLGRLALERRASYTPISTSTSRNTDALPSRKKNKVVFDKVAIREHKVTIGDNPACSYGTPISLDWDYMDFEDLPLTDYEMHKFTSGRGRPRTLRQLYMNHFQRIERLQQEGYTMEQIKKSKHDTNKARKQREMTRFLSHAKVFVHLEDMVESASRKVSRAMTTTTNTTTTSPTTRSNGIYQPQRKPSPSPQYYCNNKPKLTLKEQERQLLIKVLEGDDTVDTARVVQAETGRTTVRPTTTMSSHGRIVPKATSTYKQPITLKKKEK